jgi:ribonucleoside-diphosphate reductase alpha chain
MYGWSKGLKTGCYYLRSQEATTAQKFTVDESLLDKDVEYIPPTITGPDEDCIVCGS